VPPGAALFRFSIDIRACNAGLLAKHAVITHQTEVERFAQPSQAIAVQYTFFLTFRTSRLDTCLRRAGAFRKTCAAFPASDGRLEDLTPGAGQQACSHDESEASNHTPSLADFTITTPELKFSVHTRSDVAKRMAAEPDLRQVAIFSTHHHRREHGFGWAGPITNFAADKDSTLFDRRNRKLAQIGIIGAGKRQIQMVGVHDTSLRIRVGRLRFCVILLLREQRDSGTHTVLALPHGK
jgi:hypothetical protein